MKFITILGARPQFIKAAPVSRELRKHHTELIVHTGQHYDKNMSDIFFEELNIPKPDFNLEIGSSSHGKQTGRMLVKIEEILLAETPEYVLVYGDTNSTLAGALAACKLHIPVVHVEAGLRSFNKEMPEEINRIMTDHVSEYLFCPTETAVKNLKNENVNAKIINVGDVMYDAVEYNRDLAETQSDILESQQIERGSYHLITVHRAENTDDPIKLSNILEAFTQIEEMKVWPLHPRTKNKIADYGLDLSSIPNLKIIEPVGYLDMLKLESNAKKILTDSGGVQKEAYFVEVPCVTMREQTEWVETLEDDANILVGTNTDEIVQAALNDVTPSYKPYFGTADAAKKIVEKLT
ncbi:non-hydrolyzing UDP-N-acetylglucosamine 2-epimerase [Pseudalkalibacillus sp. A8]|uniref:non-hydrolyzing UDP-N-acetylglucosamine 2-epimerase n=1 Tax=Pseudalkalibacillus sp. A8 TaxID=3382641 RepID=UPI0038B4E948